MNSTTRGANGMPSRLMMAVAVVICTAAAGCQDNNAAPPKSQGSPNPLPATKPAAASTNPFPTKLDPPVHDWKTPAAALLLTGEQHGYFEPCGCSLHQLGGMARRGDLVRMLTEERKWPLAGVDLGGTLKHNRRQDQIKFESLLNAFKHLNYIGVGLGVEELRLGPDFLLQQQVAEGDEAQKAVPLISANVQFYDPPFPGWPLRHRVVKIGEVKVGVTAIVGPSLREHVSPAGVNSNITVLDPAEVLPQVIAELEAEKPAFLVLLSHGNEQEAKQLATKFPQFQIILTAGGPEEPEAKPVVVGKTWILQAGHKGKRVGILAYYPDNADQPFRYDLVQLDEDRFQDDPYMRTLMRTLQQQVQDEGLATSDELLLKHPSGNTFVGAAKCGECHKKAYEHWKETKHADGLKSLKVGHSEDVQEVIQVRRPDGTVESIQQEKDWIVRIHDPECLSCHVTGWEPQQMLRYDSGYFSEERTPLLVGQQCENCHGPGSKHVALEESLVAKIADLKMDDVNAARAAVRRTVEEARRRMCVECHDSDNSPKFKPDAFNDYWEQVKHPWKD